MQWSRSGTINPHATVKKERKNRSHRSHINPPVRKKNSHKKNVNIIFNFHLVTLFHNSANNYQIFLHFGGFNLLNTSLFS